MTIAHTIVDGKHIAEVTNDSFADGQPAIVFLPGIGETDNTGTEKGLFEIEKLTVIAGDDPKSLYKSADHFKINIVTTAPKSQYQYGEIHAAVKAAKENLKAGSLYAMVASLGGYGLAKEIGKDANLAKEFDAICWQAMGPGIHSETAKHLAEAKVPNYFLVAEDDDVTTPNTTYNLHKAILALGGISYLTVFKAGSFKSPHVIFGNLINAWDAPSNKPLSSLSTTVPQMSVYQWFLSNRKGSPVVAPSEKYKPITLPEDPVIATHLLKVHRSGKITTTQTT